VTIAFITNDLHLGKTNPNVDLQAELLKYVEWLCKESASYPSLDDKILIVNGDFFDPKKSLTIDQHALAEEVFSKFVSAFDHVIFNLGNHDVPGRAVVKKSLFDLFKLDPKISVFSEAERYTIGSVDLIICPFGKFREAPPEVTEEIYVTHDNDQIFRGFKGPFINGHVHTFSTLPNGVNMGTPYQLEWSNVGNPGGFIVVEGDGTILRVPYKRDIFKRVRLEDGKIEGKNPVKWITENRKNIEGTCLEVSVAEDVDKTLYSKFLGVLATVDLADLKLVEDISFTTDKQMSNSKPNFAESLEPLLSRDGAKEKLKSILNDIGA
jgi:DNA repair exonuclease SbcCD nuclease subunit